MKGNWAVAAIGAGLLAVFLALRVLEKTAAPPPLPPPTPAPVFPPDEPPPAVAPPPAPVQPQATAGPGPAPVAPVLPPVVAADPNSCEGRMTLNELARLAVRPAVYKGETRPLPMDVFDAAICEAVALGDWRRCSALTVLKRGSDFEQQCRNFFFDWRFYGAALRGEPSAAELCVEAKMFSEASGPTADRAACKAWADFVGGRLPPDKACESIVAAVGADGIGGARECVDSLSRFGGEPDGCAAIRDLGQRKQCVNLAHIRRALKVGVGACGDIAACRAAVSRDPKACAPLIGRLAKDFCGKQEALEASILKEEEYRRRNKLPSFKPGDEILHVMPKAQREAAIERVWLKDPAGGPDAAPPEAPPPPTP